MSRTYEILRDAVMLAVAGAAIVWVGIRWLKNTREDPARLIFKWILSAVVIGLLLWKVAPFVAGGGEAGAFIGIPLAAGCALILAILWGANIGGAFAGIFTGMLDGGDEPPEPKPAYSVARARRNQGRFLEAVVAVREQLARFPNDLEGVLLLAALQAENLNDLSEAELTLSRFCERPESPPQQVAAALYQLADWHLKLAKDPDAARRTLERVVARFPDTERAKQAAQRIAHLASREFLLEAQDRAAVAVTPGVQNLGLLRDQDHLKPVQADPAELAAGYVRQLEQHPHDTEAREKLAVLYAEHYQRLDLATDQLEQLVRAHPDSPKAVARWLNLLADLQIQRGADDEVVRRSLQTIIDRFPELAVAEHARRRLDHLRLEFKGKEKSQAVPLGSYEQNLGLKRKR